MAKGKHATALFEVIHASNRAHPGRTQNQLATPGWFKPRPARPPAASSADPMAVARAELAAANGIPPAPPEPKIIERIVEIEKPIYIDRPVPVPTRSLDDDVPLQLDSANHEIKFRLSYVGAIAAGFVLLVALAMAYLIGTRSTEVGVVDPSAVTGSTTGDTSTATASGQSMMAAVSPAPVSAPGTPAAQPTPDAEPSRTEAPVVPVASPTLSTTAAPSGPVAVEREAGMHYVIAQSYPVFDTAEKACAFLNGRGIDCTVVRGPAGWAPGRWYSVVGVQPFDHVQHNPALDAYMRSIEDVATQFAGNQRFIRFRPQPYKWTDHSEPAAQ